MWEQTSCLYVGQTLLSVWNGGCYLSRLVADTAPLLLTLHPQ
jgi:hypothetical protein